MKGRHFSTLRFTNIDSYCRTQASGQDCVRSQIDPHGKPRTVGKVKCCWIAKKARILFETGPHLYMFA